MYSVVMTRHHTVVVLEVWMMAGVFFYSIAILQSAIYTYHTCQLIKLSTIFLMEMGEGYFGDLLTFVDICYADYCSCNAIQSLAMVYAP